MDFDNENTFLKNFIFHKVCLTDTMNTMVKNRMTILMRLVIFISSVSLASSWENHAISSHITPPFLNGKCEGWRIIFRMFLSGLLLFFYLLFVDRPCNPTNHCDDQNCNGNASETPSYRVYHFIKRLK